MQIIRQMRALPKPPRSEGIAQLAVLKGVFFHFLPKHLVLPLSEKASGVNGPWGWSNLAISTFRRDTASVLRCQGKGCVAVSRSFMCTHTWPGFVHPEGQTGVGTTHDQQNCRWCVVWTPRKPVILGKSVHLHPLHHCHPQLLRL